MALAHFQRTVQDASGNISPSAAFEVRNEATGNLATIYSDRAGGVGISNPNTASVAGLIDFYVVGGAYRITVTGGADWRYVPIGTAAEYDIADLIAAQDAMVLKGVIDCSGNPNYPAADRGHTYKISVAGQIGGGSGPVVEAGDTVYCITDGTAAGTHAAVGANWVIVPANIDTATNAVAGKFKVSTSASTATGTATDEVTRVADVRANYVAQGKHTIWIPASAMWPRSTNGPAIVSRELTTGGDIMVKGWAFDAATEEGVQFYIAFPKSWNKDTISFQAFWTNINGLTTETVSWGLSAGAFSDSDPIDTTDLGTEVRVSDTWLAANDLHVTAESAAVTVGNTPVDDDLVICQIVRSVANDNMTGDAELLGVKIFHSVNLANDS